MASHEWISNLFQPTFKAIDLHITEDQESNQLPDDPRDIYDKVYRKITEALKNDVCAEEEKNVETAANEVCTSVILSRNDDADLRRLGSTERNDKDDISILVKAYNNLKRRTLRLLVETALGQDQTKLAKKNFKLQKSKNQELQRQLEKMKFENVKLRSVSQSRGDEIVELRSMLDKLSRSIDKQKHKYSTLRDSLKHSVELLKKQDEMKHMPRKLNLSPIYHVDIIPTNPTLIGINTYKRLKQNNEALQKELESCKEENMQLTETLKCLQKHFKCLDNTRPSDLKTFNLI